MESGVGSGDVEGRRGDVDSGEAGVRQMVGEGDGDGSGTGADVEDVKRCGGIELLEDGFDEVLGLGARDEDGG